jgi:undecaprenyl phosphate N,N'-diacetylbacillosamine 1-phosphate transferase
MVFSNVCSTSRNQLKLKINKFQAYLPVKRSLDIVLSILAITVLSPFFIVLATVIKMEDGGCVFFKQKRVGKNGKLFELYKFRSMRDKKRESNSQTYNNSPEVTKIGQIIRRFKIDELPQLINVIKGDLSIIGPRPCLPQTSREFGIKSNLRHSLRPGLSGISQISGNIYLTWEERLDLDLKYIQNISFFLDIVIIFKTIILVIIGEEWGKRSSK